MTRSWLWLFGPPGVGKSAAGFRLFQRLAAMGKHVAFIEIDQIGMCMPATDSARSAAKTANLLGVLDNFAAVGAAVIVTGDIVETMHEVLDRAPTRPVLCRLRADDAVAVERLSGRGGLQYAMSSQVYESFDVPNADIDVTTSNASVEDVVDEILRQLGTWPAEVHVAEEPSRPEPTPLCGAEAIMITGPRAVGTSTVAWQVLMESVATGHPTGFLDLGQLGFLSEADQDQPSVVALANVAACWTGFRGQGAERLVLCGHVDDRDVTALRSLVSSLRVVALSATSDTLLERARRRRQHRDIELPGDDLFGRSDDHLREVVRTVPPVLEDADLTVATDGMEPTDVAARISPLWLATT